MSARKIRKADRLSPIWWLPLVILMVASVIVVVMNIFGRQMDEWVTWIVAGAIVIAIFFFWKRRDGHWWSRLLMSLAGVAVGLACLGAAYINPYWNAAIMGMDTVTRTVNSELYASAALEDLRYMMHYVQKIHPALINGLPQEIWDKYAIALGQLESQPSISLMDYTRLAQGLLAPLGDAQTGVSLTYSHTDEPHILGNLAEHTKRQDELVGVNGISFEQLYDKSRDLVIAESDAYGASRVAEMVTTLEGLEYLGIPVEEGVTYTWRRIDGVDIDEEVTTEGFLTPKEYDDLYGETAGPTNDFVHWEVDTDNDLAVLTLTACVDNDEYRDALHDMFSAIKEHGITNLAVDLRHNFGGTTKAATEFLRYINVPSYRMWGSDLRLGSKILQQPGEVVENKIYENLVYSGNLYVLTSADTTSAAMMFAMLIQDNHLGTIIGEAPGNDPNGYGEVVIFELPNSHLMLSVSSKQWRRIDSTAQGLIEPDVQADPDKAEEELLTLLKQGA